VREARTSAQDTVPTRSKKLMILHKVDLQDMIDFLLRLRRTRRRRTNLTRRRDKLWNQLRSSKKTHLNESRLLHKPVEN
jgi:hypothetical protein